MILSLIWHRWAPLPVRAHLFSYNKEKSVYALDRFIHFLFLTKERLGVLEYWNVIQTLACMNVYSIHSSTSIRFIWKMHISGDFINYNCWFRIGDKKKRNDNNIIDIIQSYYWIMITTFSLQFMPLLPELTINKKKKIEQNDAKTSTKMDSRKVISFELRIHNEGTTHETENNIF